MATEMIENTEMGAFAQSRLGNKCFLDDNNFANFGDDDYTNFTLFGKKINFFGDETAKKNTEKRRQEIYKQFAIPKEKENDCKWLNDKLAQATNMLEAAVRWQKKKRLKNREINPLSDVISNLKTAIEKNECLEKKESEKAEKTQAEAIKAINEASSTNLPDVGQDTSGSNKTTNYIMYGIGGLVAIVVVAVLLKRK